MLPAHTSLRAISWQSVTVILPGSWCCPQHSLLWRLVTNCSQIVIVMWIMTVSIGPSQGPLVLGIV